jgi:hypothetical protein
MLRVFVFDERESRAAEDVRAALDELAEGARCSGLLCATRPVR